jgi:hypothetical protein
MAEPFKLPISPEQLNGIQSVSRTEVFGTNYSVLGIGGYMEVYNISDLTFEIPSGVTGTISLSSNTIPINFIKGSGSAYSPDILVMGSDNLSSGRRRLGMLAYVYETDQIYQYRIDNYDTLWAAATGATGVGGDTVVMSDFGTTVKNNSVAGQNFINAWTANTIEDVSGETSVTAVWKKLTTGGGGGSGITGGTYYPNTLTLDLESTGGTISIGNVTGLYISAGTYSSGTSTLDLYNSTGGTISVTGITAGSGGATGLTPSDYVVQGKLNANQSISANTDVIIQFVDDFDPQNWWNASTYQLTPTIAGYYNIFVGVWLDNPGVTNNQANIQVRKNGNSFVIVQNPLNNVTGQAFEASKIVYLNGTTDYIEFTIFQGSTGSVNILQGTANGSGTWFSASLIVGGNSAFTGGGTTNYISKWTSSSSLGNSQIFDNGTSVGFGTSSPSSSSIVDLTSSSKGFLPPRMTEAQRNAISSPTIGLMVYQTNGSDGVYVYKASGWVQMI